jgi:hypothetical protein
VAHYKCLLGGVEGIARYHWALVDGHGVCGVAASVPDESVLVVGGTRDWCAFKHPSNSPTEVEMSRVKPLVKTTKHIKLHVQM